MAAISLRLPDEIEILLGREAEREGRSRSEIVREAIAEYVARRERERFMTDVVVAANAIRRDDAANRESRALANTSDKQIVDDANDDRNGEWWR